MILRERGEIKHSISIKYKDISIKNIWNMFLLYLKIFEIYYDEINCIKEIVHSPGKLYIIRCWEGKCTCNHLQVSFEDFIYYK